MNHGAAEKSKMAANMAANFMENEYIHKISCYNMLPVNFLWTSHAHRRPLRDCIRPFNDNAGNIKLVEMILFFQTFNRQKEHHMHEGLDGGGGVWYSLFIKNLAHYSSH